MNRLQRNVSAGKKMLRIIKKSMACLLVLHLALSPAIPGLTVTAMADDEETPELPDEDLGDGACESTAYGWIYNSSGWEYDDASYRFDLHGMMEGDTDYDHSKMITTFVTALGQRTGTATGYATWIKTGGKTYKATGRHNGNVEILKDMGLELKIAVSPSPDNKYVFVDYYVYNRSTELKEGVQLGTGCDDKIGGGTGNPNDDDDGAILYKNTRGFHMVNRYTNTTFDCITYDPALGITEDADTKWIGVVNNWPDNVFVDGGGGDSGTISDTAMAYSWKFDLRKYETVHKRVAFVARATSYYVSKADGSDEASARGTYQEPFQSLEHALEKLQGKKGYIYIMDDEEISNPIMITGPTTDITIASTDFDQSGQPTTGKTGYIKTLKRADCTKPLFTVGDENSGQGTLKFTDISLDGNSQTSGAPLIKAASGRLELNSGAEIKNCIGGGESPDGAVVITNSASLSMNSATVSGNTSYGKGAVYFNSTGSFDVVNNVFVKGNTGPAEKKANVYLASGKSMTVDGDMGSSSIGVTAEQQPKVSLNGITTAAEQEVKIAVPKAVNMAGDCVFADNFFADQEENGSYVTVGTKGLGGDGDNGKNAVLKRNGYEISFIYTDADTGGSVDVESHMDAIAEGLGDWVTIGAPDTNVTGYTWSGMDIDQGSGGGLTHDASGAITGYMPAQDVVVNYKYSRLPSGITFRSNGGLPEPPNLSGSAGEPVKARLPAVERNGYEFQGWSTENSPGASCISRLPDTFPDNPLVYYAIFKPDGNVKFHYNVTHTNQKGSITFGAEETDRSAEDHVTAEVEKVNGYVWSKDASSISPPKYSYPNDDSKKVGKFGDGGNFEGNMPAQDLTVDYRYRVDYGDDVLKPHFEVCYETEGAKALAPRDLADYYPEDVITARPREVYGYKCIGWEFSKGTDAGKRQDGGVVYPVSGQPDESSGFTFSGVMPNQDVCLVYKYEPDSSGYDLTVKYEDNKTEDSSLKEIVPPETSGPRVAESHVEGHYSQPYGYEAGSGSVKPNDGSIRFEAQGWSGEMPNGNTTITYNHDRDSSKWVQVTYKAGLNGYLSKDGTSKDVKWDGDGSCHAGILKDDGTEEGGQKGYTLADLEAKGLIPAAVPADKYYVFAGWFIDDDGGGSPDGNESALPPNHRFKEPVTLKACFKEAPGMWIDINFAAGPHVYLEEGATTTLHTKKDSTWGSIGQNLPEVRYENHYVYNGWFAGGERVYNETPLRNGQTYTVWYDPDPNFFGTNVTAPETSAGLNGRGKGRISVYGASLGYQYILTDLSGLVLSVKKGNLGTSRAVFDGLYPGARYMAYEATGEAKVSPGDMIGAAADCVSDGVQVLTPVVDDNYRILFDEGDEGKNRLEISPADPASDYAVLDSTGRVVLTPETGSGGWQKPSGSRPRLSFTGLDYNRDYYLVTRPAGQAGITPDSRAEDGTGITTDPGGDPCLPSYIIETKNGYIKSVGGQPVGTKRYESAHKGDKVEITAGEPEDGERFVCWELTIGSVNGYKDRIPAVDAAFDMPDGNLVLTAVYEKGSSATPSNARVVDEVRGGNSREMALDPDAAQDLENRLTTDLDRDLMAENRAHVTYKVVYQKTGVRATESDAVKNGEAYNRDHEGAFKGAWGLDVSIERLVNGRKVATCSDAVCFKTYVQLDRPDTDMKDYQLYKIDKDSEGEFHVCVVNWDEDPEKTGGLFTFNAEMGSRYVLVYSRAYRLWFLNYTAPEKYRYCFKVRKGEAPSDADYEEEYGALEQQLSYFVAGDGAEYLYKDWSYSEDKLKNFDPDRAVRRKTFVYAYYLNNEKDVEDARKEIEEEIREATELCGDYFLTSAESGELEGYIEDVQGVLDEEGPQATIGKLTQALETLKKNIGRFKKILDKRYEDYWNGQDNGDKGGSTGGGGRGTKAFPYNTTPPKAYLVGTNGNWVESDGPGGEKRFRFVLNGGTCLQGMWARLTYPEGDLQAAGGWYHFNEEGFMESGWILDDTGNWYYCGTEKEGRYGKMVTGWMLDAADGNWYYLDPSDGAMAVGWRQIDGKWYFFSPVGAGVYAYDPSKREWVYGGGKGRPQGAMYQEEVTPDGFRVGADGAWTQQEETNGKNV